MAKGTKVDEIGILRFFETGPIERVELLFMIVGEKVRERLDGNDSANGTAIQASTARKRRTKPGGETLPHPLPPEL